MNAKRLRGLQSIAASKRARGGGRRDTQGQQLYAMRLAWSGAGSKARQDFLVGVMAELCSTRRRLATSTSSVGVPDEVLDRFLSRHVISSPNDRIQATKLLDRFNEFAAAAGAPAWTARRLADQLKLRGLKSIRSRFAWWLGMRLTDPPLRPPPPGSGRSDFAPKPSQKP
jgi:hypothetical protein